MEPNHSSTINKRNLTNDQRQEIYEYLLQQSEEGKLKYGTISIAANRFSISRYTISRIWQQAQGQILNGQTTDVSSRMRGRVGRKLVHADLSKLSAIPWRSRTNIRSLAVEMKMKKSTVHNLVKRGLIKPHTNVIKPHLNDENKRKRLQFCLSMLDQSTIYTNPTFIDMFNVVHIDEKWFYMSKNSERYYKLPDETEPLRTCQSKKFITKIMFLAAVARPRFDRLGNEVFSGKIGIFPFVFQEPAKRKSKNRSAGTIETKPVSSITKGVTRTCLLEKVLPAIRYRWPEIGSKMIFIQQDNAKPHINIDDELFCEAARRDNFDIRLFFQPPNSSDMNVLDFGFFRAIQSLQHQEAPNTINELIQAVEKSYWDYSSQKLNFVFLTLQTVMVEIMKVNGSFGYKVPHMGKASLARVDSLPLQIECDVSLVRNVINRLTNSQDGEE